MKRLEFFAAIGLMALVLLATACSSTAQQGMPTTVLPSNSPAMELTGQATVAPSTPLPIGGLTVVPTIGPAVSAPTSLPNTAATITHTLSAKTPSAGTLCTNRATFVSDVTVKDNTIIAAGQRFDKTWRVRNSGTCAWTTGYQFVFERGEAMTTTTALAVPATARGATVDLTVTLTAPIAAGQHSGFWRLKTPGRTFFGDNASAIIRVVGAVAAAPGAPAPVGVLVTGVTLDPAKPIANEPIGFRVTLVNNSEWDQSLHWLVKIYQCSETPCADAALREALVNLRTSFGETPAVDSVLAPGTSVVATTEQWTPHSGACTYVAVPHYYDPVSQIAVPFFQADGVPLYQRFEVC
jgi:hypothetical protein